MIDPTLTVAETPVNVNETLPIIVGDPTFDVAETPVNPITSAGDIEPTLVVADCPSSRTVP